MITQLVDIINQIIKFGLEPNLKISKSERDLLLEKSLVNIYTLYFDIHYEYDSTDFIECDKQNYDDIRKNIKCNFPDFGLYTVTLNQLNIIPKNIIITGDSIDDLSDIIIDLLEIKWRIENNSTDDGLWYFEFIFSNHTRQHIIDLLNYLKQRK